MDNITVEDLEEKQAARDLAMAESKKMLASLTYDQLGYLMEITTIQLSLIAEENARRLGIETPHITILITDEALVQPTSKEQN